MEEWKDLTSGTDIELCPGIEVFLYDRKKVDEDNFKGLTAQYLDSGADQIYLYNQYREAVELPDMTEWNKTHKDFKLYEGEGFIPAEMQMWDHDVCSREDRAKPVFWEASSSIEKAKSGLRRHVLTFSEPYVVPRGGKGFDPLPILIKGEAEFTKLTGDITDGKVTLFLGVKKDVTPPTVTVDGKEAKLIGKTDKACFCRGDVPGKFLGLDYYAYEPTVTGGNYRAIKFFAKDCSVEYLEFMVEA
jgi:hypothetical protein